MNMERRKFIRYQIRSHAIYIYSNYSPFKGWATDISEGGMAFEYTPIEGCEPKPKIKLILTGDTFPFYQPDIPCKTIYVTKVDNDDRPFKVTGKKRCGVQYEILDPDMQEKLTFLLNSRVILQGI